MAACSGRRETPEQRYEAARALFNATTTNFFTPATVAEGERRQNLQSEAAKGYQNLVRQYAEQSNWCAQAWRHLGHLGALQTNLNEAVKCYETVEQKYPTQEWELLQAWKSSADLLWEAGRATEARKFYEKIVRQFDTTNQPSVVKLAVRGSKARMQEK